MTRRSRGVPRDRADVLLALRSRTAAARTTATRCARTLARLRALRSDLIDPTIAIYNGRVVKRTGDGAIVEFRSVIDAVKCATEVQGAMVDRNAGLPSDRRIDFRIGIHLGDVFEESDGELQVIRPGVAPMAQPSASTGEV